MKHMEQRLTSKLEERERMAAELQERLHTMEQTFNQKSQTMEMLERTSSEWNLKEKELVSQLEEKDRELNIYRQHLEHEFYVKEHELID